MTLNGENPSDEGATGILRQPKAVWATAGASVVAFMGIGLVDPILPSIAEGLDATPSQVSLLFTSYFLITAVAMLVTGFAPAASADAEPCWPAWHWSSSSPRSPAPPRPSPSWSASGRAGVWATPCSCPPRSP